MSVRLRSCATLPTFAALLLSPAALVMSGCAGSLTSTPVTAQAIAVSGNWQIASASASAASLPKISGEFSGTSGSMTGILHPAAGSTCAPRTAAVSVSGSADSNNLVTLRGTGFAGGTLTITGILAADGKSMSAATYNVIGGTCAMARPADASAQQYADITGTYKGTFYDADSATVPVVTMTAQLTQSPASDTSGNFTLTGSAQVQSNPCFPNPPQIASAQVTGGSFTITYTDPQTTNSITADGTFSTDGRTLTMTQWQLTGPCGPTFGNGTLIKQ